MIKPVRTLLDPLPWWRLEPRRESLLVDGQPSPRPTPSDLTPPTHASIPGDLHLVYIPRASASRTLRLQHINPDTYKARWFNPRTAETAMCPNPPADSSQWTIPARPSPPNEDWLLVLERN